MEKKKFTIDDIDRCLNELDFQWVDRYVYDTKTKKYERAKNSDFKGTPVLLYLKRNHNALVSVTISNEEFIISNCICRDKVERLDASLLWQDILNEKTHKVTI